MSEIFDNPKKYLTYKDKPLNANDYANPCGLMAKSYFTGIYNIIQMNINYMILLINQYL